ncbi:MAG TPA: C1 family peptidase, partial [Candidatus Kapabacteria bacterium]|nr:C1 family peptidase [Candidatus Kapabacteria bacterium]
TAREGASHMSKAKQTKRVLDARPDTLDFRDLMYVPTLVEVQPEVRLTEYRKIGVPILDQGSEGACTGFGLASVVNYLLRTRNYAPERSQASPYLLYHLARRYDEWPGEDYSGSSARGAMKGWHKHGICSVELYKSNGRIDGSVIEDCAKRPLGAYFRVNHRDIVAMHAAITEVGILYATAQVHSGWNKTTSNGNIPFEDQMLGGHAFAIVAYDEDGFWLQNSWGEDWGKDGFARISYDDWLANGTDVWVARLGAAIQVNRTRSTAQRFSAGSGVITSLDYAKLRPHIISLGNEGALRVGGTYGNTDAEVEFIINTQLPEITAGWKKKRILIYAHGGLVPETSAIQRISEYRDSFIEQEIYPLAFIWKTDFWTTLTNILKDAFSRRRPEGFLDSAKDFMLDRLDDGLEPLVRALSGLAQWSEMKENALLATNSMTGGARYAARLLAQLISADPNAYEIHLVGHSAGSILLAPLAKLFAGKKGAGPRAGLGLPIKSVTLWAPAITVDLFSETYQPLIESGAIEQFTLFTLTEKAEQDDQCAKIYHKSLLYLVSNACEEKARIPLFRDGVPILGMEKFVQKSEDLTRLIKEKKIDWVQAPNAETSKLRKSSAQHHGDFDDDSNTVQATVARILGTSAEPVKFSRTQAGRKDLRQAMVQETPQTGI